MTRIYELLLAIREMADQVDHSFGLPKPLIHHSEVSLKQTWNKDVIEETLKLTLPPDVEELWQQSAGVRLFEELSYRQWGLVIVGPDEVIEHHKKTISQRGERQFIQGDLIIGEFLGDLDLPVVRCDPSAKDYGAVVIALPMDTRKYWPAVASSLGEFIDRFLRSPDVKYWSRETD